MDIIESHNLFRNLEGLTPLIESEELTLIAQKHAKWMARRFWLSDYGLIIANNIAIGDTVDSVIRQIINQPNTRKVMFGNFTYIGYGNFKSRKGITYWAIVYT